MSQSPVQAMKGGIKIILRLELNSKLQHGIAPTRQQFFAFKLEPGFKLERTPRVGIEEKFAAVHFERQRPILFLQSLLEDRNIIGSRVTNP